ncbi:MAG: tetratricopeptide repeat protein [Bacillaceae bacterium]|nr:tetratricopeptide repeat protein [Bacillaceae bacterium]
MEQSVAAKTKQIIYHYLEIGRFETALDYIKQALENSPDDPELYYYMGYVFYRQDRNEEAVEVLHQALSYGDEYQEEIYLLLASICIDADQWVEAEENLLKVLELNPNNAEAHAHYAYLMKKTGHKEKAERLIQEAHRLDPDDEQVLRYAHLMKLGDKDKEEQFFLLERFIEQADNQVSVHLQLGLHELFRERHGQALKHFKEAYLLDPTNQFLAEVVKELEQDTHFLYAPLRWVNKIGGPAVLWIIAIAISLAGQLLGLDKFVAVFIGIYLIYAIYSWTVPLLLKIYYKLRG